MARKEQYDWLDDPFDEKKNAQVKAGMSGGSKLAVVLGCVGVLVVLLVLAVFMTLGLASAVGSLS
ncbi:MAG: hypothetical protein K6F70_07740 [Eggerthellaceae bacterium]|uniref:Flagellin N-terminal-like domain-containing protein n=1 Tax=Denitrobacterium detoxificans TaxID=79604 RepID=A0A172RYD5_9ACTN|nr:hypothetical protein [Denitrobacterium detoxificans]ANE22740.1 hypothetical protein AAY81_05950 [Denitrobacterium detoxificans]MCR5583475.1 hypothetical protein [Eggerthellaceae bacterium]SEO78068.1 hypothetical protein SAMN02910314_01194 [Denitrobacterium detoxificans]